MERKLILKNDVIETANNKIILSEKLVKRNCIIKKSTLLSGYC